VFFSNLAGSIVGLLGMIQFLMNFIEENFEIYRNRREQKTSFKQLKEKRRQIVDKNFTTYVVFDQISEPLDSGRDLLAYNNISVSSELSTNSYSKQLKQEHRH
jgi:fatty acid-binding protein DegV